MFRDKLCSFPNEIGDMRLVAAYGRKWRGFWQGRACLCGWSWGWLGFLRFLQCLPREKQGIAADALGHSFMVARLSFEVSDKKFGGRFFGWFNAHVFLVLAGAHLL